MIPMPAFNHAEVILDPATARFRLAVAWLAFDVDDVLTLDYNPDKATLGLLIERRGDHNAYRVIDGQDVTVRPGVRVDLQVTDVKVTRIAATGVTFTGVANGSRVANTGNLIGLLAEDVEIRLGHIDDGFPLGTASRIFTGRRHVAGQFDGAGGRGHVSGLEEAAQILTDIARARPTAAPVPAPTVRS